MSGFLYTDGDSLRAARAAFAAENARLTAERDFLVEEYERACGCGPQGYLHAALHLFNAIANAKIDAMLATKENES